MMSEVPEAGINHVNYCGPQHLTNTFLNHMKKYDDTVCRYDYAVFISKLFVFESAINLVGPVPLALYDLIPASIHKQTH